MRRWWSLFRKDLAALRGWLFFALFLGAADDLVKGLFLAAPDQVGWWTALVDGAASFSVDVWLLALLIGTSLLQTERDDGTLDFLDALPVSRGTVWSARMTTGGLVIAALVLSDLIVEGVGLSLRSDALDPSMHLEVIGPLYLLVWLYGIEFLALATLLSYLRRFGWMLLIVLTMLAAVIGDASPSLAVLDPTSLVEPTVVGRRVAPPWTALALHGAVAALALLGSRALFVGAGEPLLKRLDGGGGWKRSVLNLAVPAVAATVLLIGAAVLVQQSDDDEEEDLPDGLFITHSYRIGFDEPESDAALALARRADPVYATVATSLGLPEVASQPLFVDARGMGAAQHLAGTFSAATIRVGADATDHVLAHETVHALLWRANSGFVERTDAVFSVWNEGLASWVAEGLYPEQGRHTYQRTTAFLVQRHGLRPKDLLDRGAIVARLGPEAPYAIGTELIRTLDEQLGGDVGARLITALAAPDAPVLSDPEESLRALLSDLGVNLDELVATLASTAGQYDLGALAELPPPRVTLSWADDDLLLTPEQVPDGMRLAARARKNPGAGPSQYVLASSVEPDDPLRLRPRAYWDDRFELQLGWVEPDTHQTLWWPWNDTEPPERDADEDKADDASHSDTGDAEPAEEAAFEDQGPPWPPPGEQKEAR